MWGDYNLKFKNLNLLSIMNKIYLIIKLVFLIYKGRCVTKIFVEVNLK